MLMTIRNNNAYTSAVTSSICIREDNFIVKNLEDENEKYQAYRLRHNIFCQELGWVLHAQSGLEIDDYDNHAIFFGVFNNQGKLLAFLRLILPTASFMLEKEFSCLIGSNSVKKENDTAEISRLCVATEARKNKIIGNFGLHHVTMLLFKGLYQWSKINHKRYLYAVTEYNIFKLLSIKGFPCKLIGNPYKMPDGLIAVAFMIDIVEFEMVNESKRPKVISWLSRNLSNPIQQQ